MSEHGTNHSLEDEALGLPLWLFRNDHSHDCLTCMRIIATVPGDLFTTEAGRFLHKAYRELYEQRQHPSLGLIKTILVNVGGWSDDSAVGGRVTPGLLEMYAEAGSAQFSLALGLSMQEFLKSLLKPLEKLRWERRVKDAFDKGANILKATPSHQFLDAATDAIAELEVVYLDRETGPKVPRPATHHLRREVEYLERVHRGEEKEKQRIMSGFRELDAATGGFAPENLIVLAGRTSMGKTALGLDMALHAALERHITVYFSLEMSNREITHRLVAKQTDIDVLSLRSGRLDHWQYEQLKKLSEKKGLPLFLDDRPANPADIKIRSEAILDLMPGDFHIGMLVVDHLQLLGVRDRKRYESRNQQLAAYTSSLKTLAKEMSCVILAISQVNRISQRERRPPVLSDLRESGTIEENSDVVLGIYRPAVDNESSPPLEGEGRVLKNRSGPVGRFQLVWVPKQAKFVNPSTDMEEM